MIAASSTLAQSQLIQFVYTANPSYPRDTWGDTPDDRYIVTSPLCYGNAKILSDGTQLHDGDVCPGMLRIASPGERIRTLVRSPAQAAMLIIPKLLMHRVLEQQETPHRRGRFSYIDPLIKPNHQVETICRTLASAPTYDGQYSQLFIDGLAHALLACLLENHSRKAGLSTGVYGGLTDRQFMRSVEYAESMLGERLDLTQWAGVLDMTPTEFTRQFQRRTRQAPYTWFMNLRIDKAKQLMYDRRLSMVEIAFRVGFCSQSHFTQAFRRRTGCSPGRWRNQLWGS